MPNFIRISLFQMKIISISKCRLQVVIIIIAFDEIGMLIFSWALHTSSSLLLPFFFGVFALCLYFLRAHGQCANRFCVDQRTHDSSTMVSNLRKLAICHFNHPAPKLCQRGNLRSPQSCVSRRAFC